MMWMLLLLNLAFAQRSEEEAEVIRLRSTMSQRYKTGAWAAVEKSYQQMLSVDPSGKWLTDSDHLQGAMAASSRGDLAHTIERLNRIKADEEAIRWRHSLEDSSGPVELKAIEGAEIRNVHQIFAPDQLEAIFFANTLLKEEGEFNGRLPVGAYQYGDLQLLVSPFGLDLIEQSSTSQKSKNADIQEKPPKEKKTPKEKSVKEQPPKVKMEKPPREAIEWKMPSWKDRSSQSFVIVGGQRFGADASQVTGGFPPMNLYGGFVGWRRTFENQSWLLTGTTRMGWTHGQTMATTASDEGMIFTMLYVSPGMMLGYDLGPIQLQGGMAYILGQAKNPDGQFFPANLAVRTLAGTFEGLADINDDLSVLLGGSFARGPVAGEEAFIHYSDFSVGLQYQY